MITITDLHKSYGKEEILRGLDIHFEEGNIYGVVGANGAGKTTFFRCLVGLEKYQGAITSDLQPVKDYMSYLPAEVFFLPKITGREYLTLLVESRRKKIHDLDKRNLFDLPLDKYVSDYSTGMKKKLGIIGVLLQNSSIYVLDEPYNGLDFQSSLLLTELIKRLGEQGKTVILSSHIFSSLADTCDRVFLLEEGLITMTAGRAQFAQLQQQISEKLLTKNVDDFFDLLS